MSYIHLLCVRVLNECVYLLGEVGIWCLAKSLLPFISQLDKLWVYIETTKDKTTESEHKQKQKQKRNEIINGIEVTILDDPVIQELVILQYVSTFLREIRELCIKQFLSNKKSQQQNEYSFLAKFSTPKVRSLTQLLRSYSPSKANAAKSSESFSCLVFVQNKQVATTLSLL